MKKNKIYGICILWLNIMLALQVSGQDKTPENRDSLSYYISIAIANNPGIKSQKSAYEAYLQKVPQAGALADPELSTGFYTKPMDIVGGRSVANISLMQMFPWFGTKKASRTEANYMAGMQEKQYREAVDNLVLQVTEQWYAIQKFNEQLRYNKENQQLLTHLEQLAIRKFSASSGNVKPGSSSPATGGKTSATPAGTTGVAGMNMGGSSGNSAPAVTSSMAMAADGGMNSMGAETSGMSAVLRIRLEIVEIENNIESLTARIKAEKARFNTLLNREATDEVNTGKEISQVKFSLKEEEALTAIRSKNPMLAMISEEGKAYGAKAEMDRKMSLPMIGLGMQYMLIAETDNKMLSMGDMNGKDMIMPMMSVTLPVFRKKYKAQQQENKLWRETADEKFKSTFNTLKSEYYSYKNQLEDASRIVKLYEKQTTLANTTYNLVLKEFIAGKSDLANVISVQRQLLDYQLKKAEAIAGYNTMAASINKLLSFNYTIQD